MNLDQYQVQAIPMNEIFSDDQFNCRGTISVVDVQELASDIKLNGLQFPICVQPAADVHGYIPEGKKYRIIAGHRRHRAYMILEKTDAKYKLIPAMVKTGLTEIQALIHNLNENIKREALNILQEANALRRMKELGLGQEDAALAVGKTRSWVQIRYTLLELPEVIQQEAAAGILNQQQIKQIYSLPSDDDRYAAVRKIKQALENGQKGLAVGKKPEQDPYKKKRRQRNEVQEMMHYIAKETPIGYGLVTVMAGWCNGDASTAALYLAISEECKKRGVPYQIPVEELNKVAGGSTAVPASSKVSDFEDDLPAATGESGVVAQR
jgi:ParB/RepB/Spo0J family partition protein